LRTEVTLSDTGLRHSMHFVNKLPYILQTKRLIVFMRFTYDHLQSM